MILFSCISYRKLPGICLKEGIHYGTHLLSALNVSFINQVRLGKFAGQGHLVQDDQESDYSLFFHMFQNRKKLKKLKSNAVKQQQKDKVMNERLKSKGKC